MHVCVYVHIFVYTEMEAPVFNNVTHRREYVCGR